MFLNYLIENHQSDLEFIIEGGENYQHYSIAIDFGKILEADPEFVDLIMSDPILTIESCNADVVKAQNLLIKQKDSSHRNFVSIKENVHTRFFGLPCCPDMHRINFPKSSDLGRFLNVSGTVVRITQSKMLDFKMKYKCVKCQYTQTVIGDYEHRYVIRPPTKCDNPVKCRALTFTPVDKLGKSNFKDYQELKIQEQANRLSVGRIPRTMWVTLEDDLIDMCKPGDDVNICGVLRRRWQPFNADRNLDVELVLHANYIEVCNLRKSSALMFAPEVINEFDDFWRKYESNPLQGRDSILRTVCPQVYGLYMIKLALLLTVITGSNYKADKVEDPNVAFRLSKENANKNDRAVRGQCHLLLVGDPGTGKSQLLKAGVVLSPKSVLTSGTGSTRAGLTCTALKEDGEWQLEAGALVLADGGVCCIDEIGQMKEHDMTSIHEAMEQQTISIAKAGIVCKLSTQVAVVAACNPKGRYCTDESISVNVSLGTPLLSRFDLIFVLLDTRDLEWDELVVSYILFGETSDENSTNKWTVEKLKTYVRLIGTVQPKMDPVSEMIIHAYYTSQRQKECRDSSRTTVRMLDSLIRLSQAHCQLMHRSKVLPVDAIVAISLMDLSMRDYTAPDTIDALHSTFPESPDIEYLKTAKKLLLSLNLMSIWSEEIEAYSKILQIDKCVLESRLDNSDTEKRDTNCNNDSNIDVSRDDTSAFFKRDARKNKKNISIRSRKKHKTEKRDEENAKSIASKQSENKTAERQTGDEIEKQNSKNVASKQIICKTKLKFSQCSSDDDLDTILSLDSPKEIAIVNKKINHPNKQKNLNNGKRKRKSNLRNKADKKSNVVVSSGDEDFSEENALNYLPSVNDFYKNLNINFGHLISDNEDLEKQNHDKENNIQEIIVDNDKREQTEHLSGKIRNFKNKFEFKTKQKSPKETSIDPSKESEQNKFDVISTKTNSEESNSFSLIEESLVQKRETKQITPSKTSSVSSNAALKLQQFKFTKERKDQILDEDVTEPAVPKTVDVAKSSGSFTSQLSIFENSDEYDLTDL